MKKTGYEIIGMIKDSKAPYEVIDSNKYCYYWDGCNYYDEKGNDKLELFYCLNDEFEIIEEQSKIWKPKKCGERYYYISNYGKVEIGKFYNGVDSLIINSGNCFKTKKESKKMLEKIKELFKEEQ